jgi:O-antigen ligase/polysaccharide polymerase Wzy-like membrane protein
MELVPPRADAWAPRRGVSWPVVAAAVLGVVSVAPVAAGEGGYFPSAWGWLGMGACWVVGLALVLRRELLLSRLELVALGGAGFLTLWTAASLLWTSSIGLSILEVERTLAYFAVLTAALLVCRRRSALAVLTGVLAAITLVALYSLSTHLLPERFGVYVDHTQSGRLFQPIGYWNALGIFCAMGIMLALGIVGRHGNVVLRAAGGASIPLLAATTYFTFSRGAWLAAGLAFLSVVALVPTRLRYVTAALVSAPIPAVALAYAASLGPLVTARATPAQIEGPGAKAVLAIAAASIAQAMLVGTFALVEGHVGPSAAIRRAYAGVLIGAVVALVAAGIAATGSPIGSVYRVERNLTATPVNHVDLNHRLLSVSLSNRQYLWRVALRQYRAHSIVGGGAGTYATYWLEHRPEPQFVVDAHQLYLETLAELGIVGLAALSVVLVAPLVAAVRTRQHPLVPAACGAYVAFLVHAAVDWDWEVPAVTVTALIAGAVLLVQARGSTPLRLTVPVRWGGGAIAVAVAAVCGVGLAGNHAVSAGLTALADHHYQAALADARDAHRYAPWSDEPFILRGRAQLDLHHKASAARSFQVAVRKEASDWVAWQWLARATAGPQHAEAMRHLLALDPFYDVANGRP